MKKFLMATLATTTLAATAHAGSISYDFRGDFQSLDFNEEAAKPDTNKFYFKIGRIDFKGNLNEDLSYRLRWGFYSTPTYTTRDNVNTQVQLAYLTQKLGSGFSITLGKMASQIGGFEAATSGADLYLTSQSYASSLSGAGHLYNTGAANILYMTGARAEYSFGDGTQTIGLMAFNPAQDQSNNGAASGFDQNSTNAYGFVYQGAFADKAFGVMASYHQLGGTNTGAFTTAASMADDKTGLWAVGLKWDSNPILLQLDYLGQNAEYEAGTDKLTTFVFKAAYTGWENWTPRLEVTSDNQEIDVASNGSIAGTNKTMGYGAVLEYKPRKDDIFRYHVAYNYTTEDADNTKTRQEIVVGTRLLGDFLK
ncbi:porin [Bdellovibrio sp. NC01]|uniref:porin n=1 Tax=Bdellovibrio sp. NC01 TaxID=2220073 RepID=UPI001158E2A0|nr:porin [Bdellovibrio sp. NC01]QDK36527.1 hypothetical protein DOE51_02390 [Bdellovibrio sp. NC01]